MRPIRQDKKNKKNEHAKRVNPEKISDCIEKMALDKNEEKLKLKKNIDFLGAGTRELTPEETAVQKSYLDCVDG